MLKTLTVDTNSTSEFIDITARLAELVTESGIVDGVCYVYVPHTTAGITINENYDPAVARDIEATLSQLVPDLGDYLHEEGNSAAHIKATLVGSTTTLLVSNGSLSLGRWQGVYLCEFDGPRTRQIQVRIVGLPY
ncbi:MAG: YjbQ family protein [Firmicutes bacterium]|nr:YjbQ family protein [Bacillota bacterium]